MVFFYQLHAKLFGRSTAYEPVSRICLPVIVSVVYVSMFVRLCGSVFPHKSVSFSCACMLMLCICVYVEIRRFQSLGAGAYARL